MAIYASQKPTHKAQAGRYNVHAANMGKFAKPTTLIDLITNI